MAQNHIWRQERSVMVKKCSNCYWRHKKENAPHIGCYAEGKWRKWIPKKQVDIPNDCPDWKEIPEVPF